MSDPIPPPPDTLVPSKEYPMLSLEECLGKIGDLLPSYRLRFQTRNASSTLDHLRVPEELGRVFAADVYAREPFPKLPTSIMDGFLVRPVGETHPSVKKMSGIPYRELRIISNITAGHGVATVAEHCDATYVTTGTLVENADLAVVKIEDCDVSGDTVIVPVTGVVAGLNLRSVGSDIKKDELIARRGAVLTPALLAALEGVSAIVELLPVVKIAIVSSGDELVKKEVPDTNGPMLQGLLCERFGNAVEVNRLLPLEDDYNVIRKVLLEVAATNDVVITTGAVSKGSKDYIKKILEKDGKVHFGEVCLKPGKPTTFATLRETPFFGLPGNPASAYVTFFVFVEPFLRALLTADGKMENFQQFYATVAENMQQTDPMRPEYVRVTASVTPSGQIVASGTTGGDTQRSSRLLSCVGVNALVKLPAGGELVHKGARVPCVLTGRAELGNGGEDEVDDDVKAEAFAFRRLVSWLQTRTDVQNIDLMNLAGFCRNCLSKWYAEGRGVDVDEAKERVYGMSYSQWKARYQTPTSEESKIKFAEVHQGKARTACGHATGPAIHHHPGGVSEISLGVVTCSDRAAQGEYTDEAGPLVARLCGRPEAPVVVVPDEILSIQSAITDLRVRRGCNLVITTGGTGFAARDVTPEAVVSMIEKRATGIEHMLLRCCQDRSKSGMFVYLSRPVAGVLKGDTACLVVTLPGSRRAVEEILGDSKVVDVLIEAARIAVGKYIIFPMANSSSTVEAVESWPVYLIWFIHHNSYYNLRFHELEALAELCGGVSKESLYAVYDDKKAAPVHPPTALVESPWVYIRLPNDEVAKAIAERAVLVKAILSVWGSGKTIPETIEDVNKHMPREKRRAIITDELSFKYKLFAYGRKFNNRERQELMDAFGCLWDGDEKVDIENAQTTIWLISEYEHAKGPGDIKSSEVKRHFCAREVTAGRYEDKQEPYFARYELTCRPVLGPTSLDNELAFIMANLSKIDKGKIVYDCFVGTGGLALTASHFGAFVMGSDIDIRVLRGHRVAYANEGKSPLLDAVPGDSGPNDISIFRNFLCYGLARPEIIHADMAAPFWRKDAKTGGLVDVILTDPPYGIRAGTKRVGAKTEHAIDDRATYIPQKVRYETDDVMNDLLQRAVAILNDNGMLVYLLPIELSQLFTSEELDMMEKRQEMAGDNPAEKTRKRKRKQEAAARGKVAASTRVVLRDETVMMSRAGQGPKGEMEYKQCVQYRDVYAPETARDLPFLTESNYLRLLPTCPKELEVVNVSLQILSAGLGRLVVSMRRLPRQR